MCSTSPAPPPNPAASIAVALTIEKRCFCCRCTHNAGWPFVFTPAPPPGVVTCEHVFEQARAGNLRVTILRDSSWHVSRRWAAGCGFCGCPCGCFVVQPDGRGCAARPSLLAPLTFRLPPPFREGVSMKGYAVCSGVVAITLLNSRGLMSTGLSWGCDCGWYFLLLARPLLLLHTQQ